MKKKKKKKKKKTHCNVNICSGTHSIYEDQAELANTAQSPVCGVWCCDMLHPERHI
jgi:ribosomal protein L31